MAEKWMQKVSQRTKERGRVGALHRALGIPMGKKIPFDRLQNAAKKKGRLGKMARMAMQYRKANK